MTRVIAFVDYSAVSPGVVRTATALSVLLDAELDVVHVVQESGPRAPGRVDARLVDGPTEEALVAELGARDVVCGVIGSRSMLVHSDRVGHVASHVLTHSGVPLVVVPPNAPDFPTARPTILVPHDDTSTTAAALEPMLELLAGADATLVMLHVFDDHSVPATVSSHDLDTIAHEFLLRHSHGHPHRCELRIGHAGSQIVDVASGRDIDAVLVAWRQQTGPGRAEVINHLVREIDVPLIVVPFSA
jgi:nucleotide-binding universal stress UspA family protein